MEKFNAFERDIDFAFWQEICESHGELRHYRRGEYFVNSGDGLKYCAIMSGGPMPTAIIALEDSDVMIVPTKFIREYLESNPEFNLRFVQSLFSQAYGIILNGYYYSPLQRYRQLVERFPRILELVPLGEIASYLNISRRQLHRFRETPDSQAD